MTNTKQERRATDAYNKLAALVKKRFGTGTSKAAKQRRAERQRGLPVELAKPGQTVLMSRDTAYIVAKDGSFRRLKGEALIFARGTDVQQTA